MRVPKVGEVWTSSEDNPVTIKLVEGGSVCYSVSYGGNPELMLKDLKLFLTWYNPPKKPKKYYYVNEYKHHDEFGIRLGACFSSMKEVSSIMTGRGDFIRTLKLVEVIEEETE